MSLETKFPANSWKVCLQRHNVGLKTYCMSNMAMLFTMMSWLKQYVAA